MRYSDWGQVIIAAVVSSSVITGLFYLYTWSMSL
jgi:hypothetical protein